MQVKTKKIYNFNMPKVKNELVQVLKKRKNESSVADLISGSGLPKFQVEQALKVISDEYNGHLKVTESGELLYYFPSGMHSRVKGFIPAMKRFFKGFFTMLGKVLAFLFKIWIVVMLVGYFVLFVAILVLSIAVGIAISMGDRNSSRSRSSKGGFNLVIKIFQLFIRIWYYGGMLKEHSAYTPRKKDGRLLHKSVFAFVFGETDPNKDWPEREKKYVISYIQAHKGVMTIEELMAISGRNREAAQQLINEYLIEFEGSPEVTENGTIVFIFPALLRTTEQTTRSVSLSNPDKKSLVPFSYNEKKTNGFITGFNVFNLVFSAYFIGNIMLNPIIGYPSKFYLDFTLPYQLVNYLLSEISSDPNGIIFAVLGIMPMVFSAFFFLIPIMRNMRRKKINNAIKQENCRKRILQYVFQKPLLANPAGVSVTTEEEKPANVVEFTRKVFDEFAAEKQADIEAGAGNAMLYNFNEFKREIDDVLAYRSTVKLEDYAVGETVFDTNEPVK